MSAIDALGHRVLSRAAEYKAASGRDKLVGLALLRRAVTTFVGVRTLLEASSVQPALIVARAQFEILLSIRYLVHGGRRSTSFETPTHARQRETRARYYLAASVRTGIYRRQALLDGAEGARRVPKSERRRELEEELRAERARLDRYYRTQNRRFGPLRCYPSGSRKPRYYDERTWYSFGFLKDRVYSVKALARRFRMESYYFILYSPLSKFGHAGESDYDLEIGDEKAAVLSPHDPTFFPVVAYWSCAWQRLSLTYAAKAYCPASMPDLQRTEAGLREALDHLGEEAATLVLH